MMAASDVRLVERASDRVEWLGSASIGPGAHVLGREYREKYRSAL